MTAQFENLKEEKDTKVKEMSVIIETLNMQIKQSMEQEDRAKKDEQKFLEQIHYLTSLLKKNSISLGSNLESVKEQLLNKTLNPEVAPNGEDSLESAERLKI